jgi:hypothetical protein
LKMRSISALFLAMILVASSVGPVAAADTRSACDAVLAKDSFVDKSNIRLSLAILNTLDTKSFEQIDKSAGAAISIPVGETLVPIKGDYKDFEQKRTELNQKHEYKFDQNISRDVAISSTSAAAIAAWSNCIQTQTREALIFRPSLVTADKIVVSAYWNPGVFGKPGHIANVKDDVTINGGKLAADKNIPVDFLAKWTDIEFDRTSGQAFFLSINLENGDAGKITIPANYSPPPCTDCLSTATVKLDAGHFHPSNSPAPKTTAQLLAGKYQVTVKSGIQGRADPRGIRPVFRYSFVSTKDDKDAANVGLGGNAVYPVDTLHDYSASTNLTLKQNSAVTVQLSVDKSFNGDGAQNVDGAGFGESVVSFKRLE